MDMALLDPSHKDEDDGVWDAPVPNRERSAEAQQSAAHSVTDHRHPPRVLADPRPCRLQGRNRSPVPPMAADRSMAAGAEIRYLCRRLQGCLRRCEAQLGPAGPRPTRYQAARRAKAEPSGVLFARRLFFRTAATGPGGNRPRPCQGKCCDAPADREDIRRSGSDRRCHLGP